MKLFDSELKLMEIVWREEPIIAKEVSSIAAETYGWNKNTTYTVLKKLVEKGAVLRREPNFTCTSCVKKDDIGRAETENLIKKLYDGSKKAFFAAFLHEKGLSKEELSELRQLIDESDGMENDINNEL